MKRWGFILILLSLLPLVNLTTPGMMDAHDAPDHVARIANFYQALTEGVVVPRWAANLNWGYGHPILMFLYPLPSYAASLFHAIGINLVDSVKLVFGVSYIASIVLFFLWASLQWNPRAGFIGAVLYGFAPYRFVDLYVRGAIGEHVAFIFPPVIFWGLLGLAKAKSRWSGVWLTVGVAGLLLSHNAVSLMVVPVALLYVLYLLRFESKYQNKFFVQAVFYASLGFAVSSFFWAPAFFEGKYTLRDIVTAGEFFSRFVPLTKFFYSGWSFGISDSLSKELGIAQWIAVVVGMIFSVSTKIGKLRVFLWGALLTLAASIFVQTAASIKIWEAMPLLAKFQFPWRFLTLCVFILGAIGSAVAFLLPKKSYIILWFMVISSVLGTYPMWKAKSYTVRPQTYYTGMYPSTTDTGESSPIWSVRFMEHEPETPIEVIEGEATVSAILRSSTLHEYTVAAQTRARLVENTLYFPGWRVWVDGTMTDIEFQDPSHRGLMTFWVRPGNHRVRVVFGQTKLRRVADTVSLVGLFVLVAAITIGLWRFR